MSCNFIMVCRQSQAIRPIVPVELGPAHNYISAPLYHNIQLVMIATKLILKSISAYMQTFNSSRDLLCNTHILAIQI